MLSRIALAAPLLPALVWAWPAPGVIPSAPAAAVALCDQPWFEDARESDDIGLAVEWARRQPALARRYPADAIVRRLLGTRLDPGH